MAWDAEVATGAPAAPEHEGWRSQDQPRWGRGGRGGRGRGKQGGWPAWWRSGGQTEWSERPGGGEHWAQWNRSSEPATPPPAATAPRGVTPPRRRRAERAERASAVAPRLVTVRRSPSVRRGQSGGEDAACRGEEPAPSERAEHERPAAEAQAQAKPPAGEEDPRVEQRSDSPEHKVDLDTSGSDSTPRKGSRDPQRGGSRGSRSPTPRAEPRCGPPHQLRPSARRVKGMHGRLYAILSRSRNAGQPWMRVDVLANAAAYANEIEVFKRAASSPKYYVAAHLGAQWMRLE